MKYLFLLSFLLILTGNFYGQGAAISENGATADPSAILDVSSHTKGVLIPRLRSNERDAIASPADGLIIYDIDSRSFWFFSAGAWREIMNSGGPINPTGPAGGDLSGSYPNPNVAKLQNLDVASGVPFDKQILKWDMVSNNWKGRNDSLFLPYNVTYSDPASLFGITNNSGSATGAAIKGKRSAIGSGITPAGTMGVWGDNSTGIGVVGTSNSGVGTFGFSFNNNGVSGYSVLANFAGVFGSHANAGGIGVLGEVQNPGVGVYGRSVGTSGKAGLFSSTNSEHTDTTFIASTNGKGTLSFFNISNPTNDKAAIDVAQAGNGIGLKLRQTKTNSIANALDVIGYGNGNAIYGRSENSTAAKFENTNATNAFPVMTMSNNSLGTLLSISSTNTGITNNVINVTNSGQGRALSVTSAKGNAGFFTISDATATIPAVSIQHPGLGRGAEIILTKTTNAQAGLYVSTAGTLGLHATSTAVNSVAMQGTSGPAVTGGIGVMGVGAPNDPSGIGVKGVAGGAISGGIGVYGEGLSSNPQAIGVKGVGYTHNEDVGAVTGINMTDGVGVYGESLGFDGIAVAGTVGNTNNHSVAGVFTNKYAENNRSVVEINTNGKGNGLLIDADNLSNNSPLLRILNSGTSQFLRLEDGLGDIKTTIAKSGDITTDGAITVKSNKGIVRNSTSTQLRTEIFTATIPSGSINHYDEFNAADYVDISFGTAFASAPSVYFGNLLSGGLGGLTARVVDVTSTGFTIEILNFTPYNFSYGTTSFKMMAIGAE